MKKFTLLVSFLLLFTISGFAQKQKTYSMANLEQASQEELNIYLDEALKLKKDGKTVTIVGGSILGATTISVILIGKSIDLGVVVVGLIGGLAGLGTMAVGIPMRITGKKRVERINNIKNTASYDIKINLKPCAQYNLVTQDYQPSVRLRINF